MKRVYACLPVWLAFACSPPAAPEESSASPAGAIASTAPAPANEPTAPVVSAPGRMASYSSLEKCKLVREEREEMPYSETLCAGSAAWALRIADSDARQTMAVVAPDGRETRLDTARIGGGGFSSFGGTAEWRGPAGNAAAPDALIVRYQLAEQPHPAPETSYLLAVRLRPAPCIVARIAPGPSQNERARAAADRPAACPGS